MKGYFVTRGKSYNHTNMNKKLERNLKLNARFKASNFDINDYEYTDLKTQRSLKNDRFFITRWINYVLPKTNGKFFGWTDKIGKKTFVFHTSSKCHNLGIVSCYIRLVSKSSITPNQWRTLLRENKNIHKS